MKNIEVITKLKYLTTCFEDRHKTSKYIGISAFVMNNILSGTNLPEIKIRLKIEKAFDSLLLFNINDKINKEYKEIIVDVVKNYDDDESLTDLKTWNSKHGVNKSHRAFSGHSN